MIGVELRHLRCLVALAEEKHFGRAAQRLGTTQPAVSQLLKRLEDLTGQKLVERDRLALALTPVGLEVLAQARQALAAVDGALEATRRSLRGESGRLRVGVAAPSLFSVVPALVRRFRAARPGVQVEMRVLHSQEQAAALLERQVDVAFGTLPLRHAALAQRQVADEAMVVVLPACHALAGLPAVSLAQLRGEAWVPPPRGTALHDDFLQHCRAAGYAPLVAAESPDFMTAFALVMAGAGIALAAESFRGFAGPGLALVPLAGAAPRITHRMTSRRGDASPVLAAMLALLEEP